jgi:hypothetical protein
MRLRMGNYSIYLTGLLWEFKTITHNYHAWLLKPPDEGLMGDVDTTPKYHPTDYFLLTRHTLASATWAKHSQFISEGHTDIFMPPDLMNQEHSQECLTWMFPWGNITQIQMEGILQNNSLGILWNCQCHKRKGGRGWESVLIKGD